MDVRYDDDGKVVCNVKPEHVQVVCDKDVGSGSGYAPVCVDKVVSNDRGDGKPAVGVISMVYEDGSVDILYEDGKLLTLGEDALKSNDVQVVSVVMASGEDAQDREGVLNVGKKVIGPSRDDGK